MRAVFLFAVLLVLGVAAYAAETITYTYDARGRLVTVDHGATGPNAGVTSAYTYDKADNRAQVVVNTGGGSTTITLSPATLPGGTVGTAYNQTISASGGTSPYTYTTSAGALPAGVTLNSTTGVLSGTPTTAATYNFTITATDGASHTGSQAYSVIISAAGVTVTVNPTSLPNGTVGTAYSNTITASGGTSPYTYTKSAGTLPAGLTLNSTTGVLSGTPTTAATYSFTVTATDSASHSGSRAYSVTISAAAVTVTVNPASLPNGTVGTAYSNTITASGGTSPYTYTTSAGTLPAGLTLNGTTGVLSGTPTTAATSSFTITATDSASNSGSRAYTVTIASSASTCSGVSFAVNDSSATEGGSAVFTITKSGTTSATCSVNYASANGTAVSGTTADYTAVSGTLTFTGAQTSQTVSVATRADAKAERDETFYLNLSSPTSPATISDSQGVGTIFDDGCYLDPSTGQIICV